MSFVSESITLLQILESEKIKQLKARIESTGNQSALIEIGKLVEDALLMKKDTEAAAIMEVLRPGALDYQVNPNITDAMLLNASFFINKSEEKGFDALVEKAASTLGERASFKYVGPLAPYSFLKINLSLATQE